MELPNAYAPKEIVRIDPLADCIRTQQCLVTSLRVRVLTDKTFGSVQESSHSTEQPNQIEFRGPWVAVPSNCFYPLLANYLGKDFFGQLHVLIL